MYESQIIERLYEKKKSINAAIYDHAPLAYFALNCRDRLLERVGLQVKRRKHMRSLPDRDLFETLKNLITGQRLGVLATSDKKCSYASLVAFAQSEDLKSLVFATTRATRKYTYLKSKKDVAFLIDNRSNRESDFHNAAAVTASGVVREVEGAGGERHLSLYLAKHPHLEDFVKSPSCALFRIEVREYNLVRRFQEVNTFRLCP